MDILGKLSTNWEAQFEAETNISNFCVLAIFVVYCTMYMKYQGNEKKIIVFELFIFCA